jgi:hypothetical protein
MIVSLFSLALTLSADVGRNAGLDQAVIQMITEKNPIRAFAFLTRRADAPREVQHQ